MLPSLYDIRVIPDSRLKEILEDAKMKVANYFRIRPYELDVGYRITSLPNLYAEKIERVGDYVVRVRRYVGKVLGMFKPYVNKIIIDPINLLHEKLFRKTVTHEFIHKAQEVKGDIYRKPVYELEAEADDVTSRLL
jgi:hypothetical protein